MTFNSYSFIFVYLPVFLLGLFAIQKLYGNAVFGDKAVKLWITAMSILFFCGYGEFSAGILCISILFNSLFAAFLSRKKLFMLIAVLGNVAFLCLFKYDGNLIMPIAISFYTFQQIAYQIKLYKGEIDKFDLLDYLSYILFFPKIMQGPLADYEKVNDGISELSKKTVNSVDILNGLFLFTLGLSKKVLLSDVLGSAVNYGYSNPAGLTGLDAVIVAVCYSFQLYFDFSGYCDMAEGICKMMGMELQINFNAPYISGNIAEFWDRWHISLTKFFTRYLYIPLGGSRRGTFRTYLNILIVFFISGLWHGKGYTFLVWGMMHGVLMVVTRIYGSVADKNKKAGAGSLNGPSKVVYAVKVALTFIYVTCAWVFFRADTLSDALTVIKKMFTPSGFAGTHISIKLAECFQMDEIWYVFKVTPIPKWTYGGYVCMWMILIFTSVLIFSGKTAKMMADSFEKRLMAATCVDTGKKDGRLVFYTVILAGLFTWCVLSLGNVSTFLYVNF
ncbi:MAG: MBOAT family protein [Butyrivibrio sp.]|nr:MBOAT family protein [Butyrivibrio sp.]